MAVQVKVLELEFNELRQLLIQSPPPAQWVRAFLRWFETLEGNWRRHEPYLLELSEYLPGHLHQTQFMGLDPRLVTRLLSCLEDICAHIPLWCELDAVQSLIAELRQGRAFLHTLVGGPAVGSATAAAEKHNSDIQQTLGVLRREKDIAYIPVVASSLSAEFTRPTPGHLRKTWVKVLPLPLLEEDVISSNVVVLGATAHTDEFFRSSIRAARRLLEIRCPKARGLYFSVKTHFDVPSCAHTGFSSGIALGVLCFIEAIKSLGGRTQLTLNSGVAFTGCLDDDGRVLEVSAKTLAAKIEAVFFSTIRFFVVPWPQVADVQRECTRLQAHYPNRQLQVIGVAELEDVLSDRRLTTVIQEPWVRYAAKQMKGAKTLMMSGMLILILLATIGMLLYHPLDKNPVHYQLEGDYIHILNAETETIETIERPVRRQPNRGYTIASWMKPHFYDIDGDGTNEIFWIECDAEGMWSTMKAKRQGSETLLWERVLEFSLDYPHKSATQRTRFLADDLLVDDLDGDGNGEVFVTAGMPGVFPGLVLHLDAGTGEVEQRYSHPGHLGQLAARDLDGDGIVELLLGGTNNAFGDAVFVVLDPRDIEGHGPHQGDYEVRGFTPARHVAYLRFPATEVSRAFLSHRQRNINMLEGIEEGQVRLAVIEATYNRPDDAPVHLRVNLVFDQDLSIRSVNSNDAFDAMVENMLAKGHLSEPLDAAYWEEWIKGVQYWTGEGWQSADEYFSH